jgi:hypothetical protein
VISSSSLYTTDDKLLLLYSASFILAELLNKYDIDETFTVHSFGFGNNHDEPEMNAISELKGGQF